MELDNIIQLAKKAGIDKALLEFAEMVAAAEREDCAKLVDTAASESAQTYSACLKTAEHGPALVAAGAKAQSERLATSIRVRGQTK